MVNKTFISGNLTRDPELRYTPSGTPVCEFCIANNRRFMANGQERNEVVYIDVTVFGKHSEACSRYLQKGSSVLVEGYLTLDSWENQEGQKRQKHRITADRVEFLDKNRGDNGNQQEQQNGQYPDTNGNTNGHRYNNDFRHPRR